MLFRSVPTADQLKTLKEYVGKEVFFGIRPEDMKFCEKPASKNNMQMKVNVIEPLGAETQLYLSSKNQHLVAKVSPNYTFKISENVNFEPIMDKAKFFDKETEKTICEEVNMS